MWTNVEQYREEILLNKNVRTELHAMTRLILDQVSERSGLKTCNLYHPPYTPSNLPSGFLFICTTMI